MAHHHRKVEILDKWDIQTVLINELCDDCIRNFSPAVSQRNLSLEKHGRVLRFLDGDVDLQHSKCLGCRLIATLVQQLPKSQARGNQLRLLQRTTQNTKLDPEDLLSHVPQLAFAVFPGLAKQSLRPNDFDVGLLSGVIAPAPKPHQTGLPVNVRAVNALLQNEDYELIKGWLEYCESRHAGPCRVENLSQLPADFMCVDVRSRRITHITQGEKYFALSWAEGKHNIPLIRRDDGIFVPILHENPVEDAIRAVERLGGIYLWVFQCSVPRHNPEVKRLMLKSMDMIYENAVATIVAAPDKGSTNRLPGVEKCRSIQQPALQIGDVTLLSTLPHASRVLATTEWITRGWTYQEGILSRRMLLFTDHQVYFACAGMTCCESIERDLSSFVATSKTLDHRSKILGLEQNGMVNVNPTNLWDLFLHLHRYKGRELRKQENAINAFRGILSRSSFKDIWGVPVAFDNLPEDPTLEELTIAFMRGLWWENPYYNHKEGNARHATFSRVANFPSWSWAGWKGGKNRLHDPLNQTISNKDCNVVKDNRLGTVICLDVESGTHRNLAGRISLTDWWQEVKRRELELSPVLHVEAATFTVKIRLDETGPYICGCLPKAICGRHRDSSEKRRVRLFEDADIRTPLYQAIQEQLWCAVLLFEISLDEDRPSFATWIVNSQADSSKPAEVKGVVLLNDDTIPIMDLRWISIKLR